MNQYFATYRKEIKYVISLSEALKIKSELQALMHRDIHSSEEGYRIKSVYFDSIDNYDYESKLAGLKNRKKIRLRIYDEDTNICKLELKQKYADNQLKESIIINKVDAIKLIAGEKKVLYNYFEINPVAIRIYDIVKVNCYRPVATIEYSRTAFSYPIGDTRVTIDTNIKGCNTNFDIFDKNISYYPILNDKAILEIKYNRNSLGFIKKLLSKYSLTQTSYSKYEFGRRV